MLCNYSSKYPLQREFGTGLGVLEIEVVQKDRTIKTDPNGVILGIFSETFAPGPKIGTSGISGEPADVLYRTCEVEVFLTFSEFEHLVRRSLTPGQFAALAKNIGIFFEIHDDFYDEESGQALQPK